jgi:tetratricopeptide (TPR) repeat protein
VQFSLLRATKSAVAVAALALSLSVGGFVPVLRAQDAAAPAKNWKDRAEYDLYVSISQATDPAKRLELLNQWQDKYPTSDYIKERLQFFVATAAQAGQPLKAVDYAKQLLKIDPKDFTSLYYLAFYGPVAYAPKGNPPVPPTADQIADVELGAHGVIDNIDTAFDAKKKEASKMTDEQWTKAKNTTLAVAHNALGWADSVKKDYADAESEDKTSIGLNPENGQTAYALAGVLLADKKYQDALFYYARAAAYDGPGALPPAGRPQVLAYFNKIYAQYHGGPDGADAVLATAKANAVPPADFKIVSTADKANQESGELQKKLDANPGLKMWYAIQQSLIGDQGQSYFDANVKDAGIPGGANDIKYFKGTVISMDPADKPTKIILGVFDPTKPDATLTFEDPVTSPVKAGDVLEFSGVADSFVKEPYMLVFKDPEVPSLKKAAAPKKSGKHPVKKS